MINAGVKKIEAICKKKSMMKWDKSKHKTYNLTNKI